MKIDFEDDKKLIEYSVGDLCRYYKEKMSDTPNFDPNLKLTVNLMFDEESGKYRPERPLAIGGYNDSIDYKVNYDYIVDKFKSRFATARVTNDKLTRAIALEIHSDFFNKWSRFVNMKRYDISNRVCLILNQYDPLYNYDRYEVYDENVRTDFNGEEHNNTTYNGEEHNDVEYSGNEKNTFSQYGIEQVGNVSHSIDKSIGKETNEHDVTGYNVGDYSHDTRDTQSFSADADSVTTNNQTLIKSHDESGNVVGHIENATGTPATGRIESMNTDNLQTKVFDGRKDINERGFTNRKDNATKSFVERSDNTTRSFDERFDNSHTTTNNHLYGNIGVTTSMQLVREQYDLGLLYRFFENLIMEFMNEYTFVV